MSSLRPTVLLVLCRGGLTFTLFNATKSSWGRDAPLPPFSRHAWTNDLWPLVVMQPICSLELSTEIRAKFSLYTYLPNLAARIQYDVYSYGGKLRKYIFSEVLWDNEIWISVNSKEFAWFGVPNIFAVEQVANNETTMDLLFHTVTLTPFFLSFVGLWIATNNSLEILYSKPSS